MKIGYARVSTKKQCSSLDHQIKLLKKEGCKIVFSEVISGANKQRPELAKLFEQIKKGDVLVITSIDRLGRSLKDLVSIIDTLQKNKISFLSLKEKIDTATPTGMLMFNLMGSIAEFERNLINRRIYDGVQKAKQLGKYGGRVYSAEKSIRKNYVDMINSGKYTMDYIAKMAKVSRQTIYNWKKEFEQEGQLSFLDK